jgi:hypothetical protein
MLYYPSGMSESLRVACIACSGLALTGGRANPYPEQVIYSVYFFQNQGLFS